MTEGLDHAAELITSTFQAAVEIATPWTQPST